MIVVTVSDDCLDGSVMITLRTLNGNGGGGEDNCLDGSAMIQFRTLNGTGRGGEDDCLHDSVESLSRYIQRRRR